MSELKQCCLCRNPLDLDNTWGHNPFPLCDINDYESRACNRCNATYVIDGRIRSMEKDLKSPEDAARWCLPLRNYAKRVEIAKHLLAVEASADKNEAIQKFKERLQKAMEQMKEEERLNDTS